MKAIAYVLVAIISVYARASDIPVREVTRLVGVRSLSISPDGLLHLTSYPHQPQTPWVATLQRREPDKITYLPDVKLRSGDTVSAATVRHLRITYTVAAITPTDALIDVREEHSALGFGDINERSFYRVRIRPYTCTPDEIDAVLKPPTPVTWPIFKVAPQGQQPKGPPNEGDERS